MGETDEEEVQALTSGLVKSLKKGGLSSKQIITIDQNLLKIFKSGVPKTNMSKIVNKIATNITFRKEFFEDPLTAVSKVGFKATDPQPDIP